MNDRIKELYTQALETKFDYSGGENVKPGEYYSNYKTVLNAEKFAELIVRECIQVAVNKDSGYIHPANIAGYMAAGRSTAAQMIKEHFGIK